jgi:chitinase
LSARNVVTDNNGRATVVYTAPAAVAGQAGVDTFTLVDFVVTPLGDNFNNSLPRIASIRLVPSGVIIPPSGLVAAFTVTPTTPSEGQTVLFQSTSTAPANNPIVRAQWDFGDGDRAEGSSVQHEYDLAGTYVATLTVFDALGRSATTSRSINVTVNAATEPTADFDFSPRNPTVGTQVNFNGQLSTPGQGQRIISYEWDFGDGTTGTGERVAHTYTRLATYSVVLRVTNSQGKTSTISKTVQVQ